MVGQRGQEQISDFCGNFRRKSCYHVVEVGPLVGNVLCGELGLNLSKPNLRICWPKWWNLDGHYMLRLRQTGNAAGQQEERKRSSRSSQPFDHVRVT